MKNILGTIAFLFLLQLVLRYPGYHPPEELAGRASLFHNIMFNPQVSLGEMHNVGSFFNPVWETPYQLSGALNSCTYEPDQDLPGATYLKIRKARGEKVSLSGVVRVDRDSWASPIWHPVARFDPGSRAYLGSYPAVSYQKDTFTPVEKTSTNYNLGFSYCSAELRSGYNHKEPAIIVVDVKNKGAAKRAGLHKFDQILEVDGRRVSDLPVQVHPELRLSVTDSKR